MPATLLFLLAAAVPAFSQGMPAIEPGVSQELARWRAAHYSDIRYKLNLTLEKMSPVLKGTIEIRVKVAQVSEPGAIATGLPTPIILDWRKIKGNEDKSTISNVSINGETAVVAAPKSESRAFVPFKGIEYEESSEHLIFRTGVRSGENIIKLDFTSPILTSGSAITRYIDKEDGSEYIYSLFVPSDASTAFPVFDQPDLKARFSLTISQQIDWRKDLKPQLDWKFVSNTTGKEVIENFNGSFGRRTYYTCEFLETKPISTYVFAFAAGPFERVSEPPVSVGGTNAAATSMFGLYAQRATDAKATPPADAGGSDKMPPKSIYVRKSQAAKFQPHAAEVFRLNREAVQFFEQYFDYKFPFPKYDLVLIPEFPFGGMEHAGATFLRESAIIFPQEPTKNDHISRAVLIFHEASHQWFGDTVTMRWFDDLWLKEGFATFTAYKALERIMPEANAWKVFYERVKQAAYQTDSTKGTTAIYQPIANLSTAKSAYGNIVYNKAPAFLRQAEFYLGEDKFQTAVRAFLKKHEFGNAGWEDLVKEFEAATNTSQRRWADGWIKQPGLLIFRSKQYKNGDVVEIDVRPEDPLKAGRLWSERTKGLLRDAIVHDLEFVENINFRSSETLMFGWGKHVEASHGGTSFQFVFPNYQDYGYGIFLLDDMSRDYVLKNIQNEKDAFLRSMMWGALWDSVREGELDPRVYVELVLKVQSASFSSSERDKSRTLNEDDESTVALLLSRVGTAMNYYIARGVSSPHVSKGSTRPSDNVEPSLTVGLQTRVEDMLIERLQNAPSMGQRITFYRAFLNIAASEKARSVLKEILKSGAAGGNASVNERVKRSESDARSLTVAFLPVKTKDKFDIVTRLLILGDPDALKLLAELEKTETSDDAKRYAYAAKAGIATAENKAKYWNDFVNNKDISESWIEAAFGPWNSIRHSELTLPYLERALSELPNHKRGRKIFFVNGWLAAFIGGQRNEEALAIVNKFLADNPKLDNDLRLKILENVDLIERAVRIRARYGKN